MLEKLFQAENLPILFGFSIVLFLLIFEAGYRIGRKRRTAIDEPTRAWVTAIYSAILAMLGLLLGFSWAMAQQRFEARRELVVEEANAIGTTYLRAQALPEPHRGDVSKLIRQYVKRPPAQRFRVAQSGGGSPGNERSVRAFAGSIVGASC